jgi:hypothetical protein
MFETTLERVPRHTSESVNEGIRRNTEQRISELKDAGRQAIEDRLIELDSEWDIEQCLRHTPPVLYW